MMNKLLLCLLLACPLALLAETPAESFQQAWHQYADMDLAGDPGKDLPTGLGERIDVLGTAWASWVLGELEAGTPVQALDRRPLEGMSTNAPHTPRLSVVAQQGPWLVLALDVPFPCGGHTLLALFKHCGTTWSLALLDARNPSHSKEDVGARENLQAFLIGSTLVVASTPPWCTSCWSRIDVRMLAPGAGPEVPRILKSISLEAYRCAEPFVFRLTRTHGTTLRLDYFEWAGPEKVSRARHRLLRVPTS